MDWFITDHLGSTKLLIDQNGTHRFTGDDDPFGINLRSFGDKDSHRYTGQILDEEQGVYYYGARYYLPEIGRFLSGDPKKQYFNLYCYAGNNPIMLVDPSGLSDQDTTQTEQGKAIEASARTNTMTIAMVNMGASSDSVAAHSRHIANIAKDKKMKVEIIVVDLPSSLVGNTKYQVASAREDNRVKGGSPEEQAARLTKATHASVSQAIAYAQQKVPGVNYVNVVVGAQDSMWVFGVGGHGAHGNHQAIADWSNTYSSAHEFFHELGYYTESFHNKNRSWFYELGRSLVPGKINHNSQMNAWINQLEKGESPNYPK